MRLRRVNLRADEHLGDDGYRYAGHRMITLVANHAGTLHLDNGTVWVQHHKNSGWNLAKTNPAPNAAFWHVRYWDSGKSAYVDEPPPGDAVFTDAFNIQPASTGTDLLGFYGQWSHTQMRGWDGVTDGRVYSGAPPGGDYVPASNVGLGYSSPGYES